MGLIYHIANAVDWQQAQEAGEYRVSTRGRSLRPPESTKGHARDLAFRSLLVPESS